MNTKLHLRALIVLTCSSLAAPMALAFQDDYVWQERFKTQIVQAEKGHADAQYDIGEMYEKGSGVPVDMKKAFGWFEKSANQGHIKAQFKVAYMYYKGQGVDMNVKKAFNLMEKPANEGNVRAQFYFGQMIERGVVDKADLDEAFTWYSRSSLGGYKPADEALAELKVAMADRMRKEDERLRREEEAATKSIAKTTATPAPVPAPKQKTAPKAEPAQVAAAPAHTPASVQAAPQPAVAAVEGFQPAMRTQPTTASTLLSGTWLSLAKTPSEFLPSNVTTCNKTSDSVIECLSEEMRRNIAGTEVIYQTKAIVYAMKKDGDFKIAYRNNVTKILNAKEGDEQVTGSGDTAGIKLGWQETEHRLECKVEGDQTVNCVKNKTQKVTLKNQTQI